METIDISIDFVKSFIDEVKLNARKHEALEHLQALKNKTGKGNDFLGWVDLPETITSEELKKIEHVANEILRK